MGRKRVHAHVSATSTATVGPLCMLDIWNVDIADGWHLDCVIIYTYNIIPQKHWWIV